MDVGDAAGHHGVRHSNGGTTDPSNLWILCRTCHTEIHLRRKRGRISMEGDGNDS
ncbi:HNH endonuclease [Arthrobacter oryzae]|uniref:HNH endonuclease n=1 Tax=Arthrobacter oryzae TaxID=409290 RepID=UPI00352DE14E